MTKLFVDAPSDPFPRHYRIQESPRYGLSAFVNDMVIDYDPADPLILLTRHRLEYAERSSLPRHLPWLHAPDGIGGVRETLHECMVAPLVNPGPVGIDFQDFRSALHHGGELWMSRCHFANASLAREAITRPVTPSGFDRPVAASSIHIRAPECFSLDDYDTVVRSLEGATPLVGPETLLLSSVQFEVRAGISVAIMLVGGNP